MTAAGSEYELHDIQGNYKVDLSLNDTLVFSLCEPMLIKHFESNKTEHTFVARNVSGIEHTLSSGNYEDSTTANKLGNLVVIRNTTHRCLEVANRSMSFMVEIMCGSVYTPPTYWSEDPCTLHTKMMDPQGCPISKRARSHHKLEN